VKSFAIIPSAPAGVAGIVDAGSEWTPGALNAVLQRCLTGRTRTMNAAIDLSIGFYAVTDDPTVAMRADRCKRMDCAFEAVECVMLSRYDHFKRLVVVILANFAFGHAQLFRASEALRRCLSAF